MRLADEKADAVEVCESAFALNTPIDQARWWPAGLWHPAAPGRPDAANFAERQDMAILSQEPHGPRLALADQTPQTVKPAQ